MPDLGEGLEEGRIVEWLVAEGDTVELNQPFVEVETAKAAVEIPSPFAGTVVALHGTVGEDVPVGDPLATFEVEGSGSASPGPLPSLAFARSVQMVPGSRRPLLRPTVRLPARRRPFAGSPRSSVSISRRSPAPGLTAASPRTTFGRPAEAVRTAPPARSRSVIAANLERQASIPQVTTFRTVDCSALQSFRADVGLSPLPIVVAAVARTATLPPTAHRGMGRRGARDAFERRRRARGRQRARAGGAGPARRRNERAASRSPRRSARLADGARAGTLAPRGR